MMRGVEGRSRRRGTARIRLTAAALLPLLAGWLACGDEPPPETPAARPVKILTLGDAGATRTLEYPGQIEAGQRADLGFEVPGQIVEFPVQEGQEVEKGQVLARLDPRDYEARLEARQALVNASRAELARTQELFDRDVKSQQELDRALRNFEVTQANLRTDQKALEDTSLRAPFAGRVARKLVDDFRNVQAKEPVLVLQNDASLEIVVNVPERDWALQRRDLPPEERRRRARPRVRISTYPDREFPARVSEVATTADPTTRTFAVTLVFEKPDDVTVLPGMTAMAAIDVAGQGGAGGGFAVPVRAVLQDQGDVPYVWRVDPESMTVEKVPVSLGELSGDSVEVTEGLRPGDRIAVSGVHELREGMAVRPFDG